MKERKNPAEEAAPDQKSVSAQNQEKEKDRNRGNARDQSRGKEKGRNREKKSVLIQKKESIENERSLVRIPRINESVPHLPVDLGSTIANTRKAREHRNDEYQNYRRKTESVETIVRTEAAAIFAPAPTPITQEADTRKRKNRRKRKKSTLNEK